MRAIFVLDPFWQKYIQALWREKTALFTAIISAIGKSLSATGFALALRQLLQNLTEQPSGLTWAVISALAMAWLAAGFGLANRYSVISLVQGVVHEIRQDLVARLMTLGPHTVARLGRADLLDIVVHDTERVDRMTTSLVGSITPAVFLVIGYLLALLMIAPAFGAVSICIGVLYWFCDHFMRDTITLHVNRYATAFSGLNRGVLLTIERLGIIRAGGLSGIELEERKADLDSLRKVATATDQALGTIAEARGLFGNAATVLLIIAASLISTSGLLMADIMTAYLFLFMIRSQVVVTDATVPDVKIGMAAFSRLQGILQAPDDRPYCGKRQIAFKGNLELKNVSFGFEPAPLLCGLTLTVRQGSNIVITGVNGSGKTTLLNLILGVYRPSSGQVLAEGVPYDELDLPSLLGSVGYVPQDPMLFAGSITQNISYGQAKTPLEQIEHAARLAGAHDFITAFPSGYDTEVGDQGVLLSGGQKQRIALARALLGHHSLLILDEPTNHMDQQSVSALLGTLTGREGSPTLLIITHDETLLEAADKVFELRGGALLEPGNVLPFDSTLVHNQTGFSLHS